MEESKTEKISAGSFDLNKWLFGGYESGVITMIAGPPGSGKTNFCILATCSQAKKGNKVIFIDTEGGFSPERVRQVVGENYKDVLNNIFLLEPKSFEEQKKSFQKLLESVKKDQISLIIIDGIAMLYRLELGDAVKVGESEVVKGVNREVANQMRVLAEIARVQNIPIIITNQVYKEFQSDKDWRKGKKAEVNLVGGDLFKYWSKCIIELKVERDRRKAVLIKHRSLPQKEMVFEIKDKGIFKKGWM
jgi:DNA repair protein RadB